MQTIELRWIMQETKGFAGFFGGRAFMLQYNDGGVWKPVPTEYVSAEYMASQKALLPKGPS